MIRRVPYPIGLAGTRPRTIDVNRYIGELAVPVYQGEVYFYDVCKEMGRKFMLSEAKKQNITIGNLDDGDESEGDDDDAEIER